MSQAVDASPEGLLRVDKRGGVTSHDIVAEVRKCLGTRAVGHAGTLDPLATGLLVVLVGRATRLSAHLTAGDKRYLATVRFHSATDTLDADGRVVASRPEGTPAPAREAVERALAGLLGPLEQVPPAVSAIKVGGVPMHERVRRGEEVALAARAVTLHEAAVLAQRGLDVDLAVHCSKGFYVRSLARDLAGALGTLGHLVALRRVASGALTVDGAVDGAVLARARGGDAEALGAVRRALEPLGSLGRYLPTVTVDAAAAEALSHGRKVPLEGVQGERLVYGPGGAVVCLGVCEGGVLSVLRGF
ncbi:MAG: tRNA pseudouridine(55) synthase TruB [Deltaproteobacteria bacterium]|nr:tRNA pseudouridine(55) synthase TruB [Deltaproteobacteria bacterium]